VFRKPLIAASAVLFLDQLTKLIIRSGLSEGESIPLIRNVFHISLVHNTGAAFGLFRHQTLILTGISILTFVVILLFYRRIAASMRILRVGFALIAGGSLGNLIDRLRFGYVVDFLDFRVWPVFNIADSAITVGVILVLWKTLNVKKGTK
jgi:signal peptidase II